MALKPEVVSLVLFPVARVTTADRSTAPTRLRSGGL